MSEDLCAQRHPEHDLTCRLSTSRHADHLAGFGADLVTWPADPDTYRASQVGRHDLTDVALRIMRGKALSPAERHQRKG